MKSIEERIKALQHLVEVQLSDGNWDYDAYMLGLANGLLLAEHTISDREGEVCFRHAPREWGIDRYKRMRREEKDNGEEDTLPA